MFHISKFNTTLTNVRFTGFIPEIIVDENITPLDTTVYIDYYYEYKIEYLENYFTDIIVETTQLEPNQLHIITIGDIQYKINIRVGHAEILKYYGSATSLKIPETVQYNNVDYNIIKLVENAFIDNTILKTVSMSSILIIDKNCFNNLTSIYFEKFIPDIIPDFIKVEYAYINEYCKYKQDYLLTYFNNIVVLQEPQIYTAQDITYKINIIERYAEVISCSSTSDTIDIPPTIRYIDIDYPIITLYPLVFAEKINLKTLVMSDNITEIGSQCFIGCTNLVNITLSKNIKIIQQGTFSKCGIIDIVLPESVTHISYEVFFGCEKLTSAILTNVGCIEYGAFGSCGKLTNVKFSQKTSHIGEKAFADCGFSQIEIPPLARFGDWAFRNCNNLTTVYLRSNPSTSFPQGFLSIFRDCNILQNIYVDHPEILSRFMFGDAYSDRLVINLSLFSPYIYTGYKYDTFTNIKYVCFELNNFLIGTYDNKLYKAPDNVSINGYNTSERQIVYIPKKCKINNKTYNIDRVLSNTFTNIKVAIFPTTEYTIENNAFANINTFIFTGKSPVFINNNTKFENVYINPFYNTASNRQYLRKHFNNIFIGIPLGLPANTDILCLVNGAYKNVKIQSVHVSSIVKTINGDRIVKRVSRNNVNLPLYVSNNISVYAFTGILVYILSENNICYGKINNKYIVTAASHSFFTKSNTIPSVMYKFVFDTTDEFTCYDAIIKNIYVFTGSTNRHANDVSSRCLGPNIRKPSNAYVLIVVMTTSLTVFPLNILFIICCANFSSSGTQSDTPSDSTITTILQSNGYEFIE